MDYNKVLLMGNLTRDPELRYLTSGTAVCDLGLAVNRRFRKSDGEQGEETCFVDVVVWARQAETCSQYLKKGSGVFVEGRLKLDSWETSEGQKRSKHSIRVDNFQFLGAPGASGQGDDRSVASPQVPAPSAPTGAPPGPDDTPF